MTFNVYLMVSRLYGNLKAETNSTLAFISNFLKKLILLRKWDVLNYKYMREKLKSFSFWNIGRCKLQMLFDLPKIFSPIANGTHPHDSNSEIRILRSLIRAHWRWVVAKFVALCYDPKIIYYIRYLI